MQMLTKNLTSVRKGTCLSRIRRKGVSRTPFGDGPKNVVYAFGRKICEQKEHEIRSQNLAGARRNALEVFPFDFADQLTTNERGTILSSFSKALSFVTRDGRD